MSNQTLYAGKMVKLQAEPDNSMEDAPAVKALRVAAYPVAGAVGYSFAEPVIRNAAYDNLKYHGAFSDMRPAHTKALGEIVERFHAQKPVNVLQETRKLHDAYTLRVNKRLAELGLGDIAKQWQFIHKSQRQSALMHGLSAAGVSLGVILTAVNNRALFHAVDTHAKESVGQEPGLP